jgi:four helix bundle protein
MQRFTELKVWQLGHALTLDVYRETRSFPDDERFGLVSQIRRSAAGVPSNIAEGSKRRSNKDYAHFLNLAESSLAETEYHLILSRDLEYIPSATAESLLARIAELSRMLHALRIKVEQNA